MQMEGKIRELAYLKWEAAGCPQTDGVEFWLQAEEELKAFDDRVCKKSNRKVAAKASVGKKN